MNIKNESMNDWVGKIPGSKDKKKVESDFWRYFKKVIGQIPFAEDVVFEHNHCIVSKGLF